MGIFSIFRRKSKAVFEPVPHIARTPKPASAHLLVAQGLGVVELRGIVE